MSKKIDDRIPREAGRGAFPDVAAVQTPWNKLISVHDAHHYIMKHVGMFDADFMQVMRILIPDYEDRVNRLCTTISNIGYAIYAGDYGPMTCARLNLHPFMEGNFVSGLLGDDGDEYLLMNGRVNDFGTHRLEKELDTCYWDIVGSDFCRTTVVGLQHQGTGLNATMGTDGPQLDFAMVEAKGCGDLHCRIVAEDRKKFPMPEHKIWESFGPIATADQIKFTTEDECQSESQIYRGECNYTYTSGTNREAGAAESYCTAVMTNLASYYFEPVLQQMIKSGETTEETVKNVIRCVFEACGKSMFRDFYAVEGLRSWLGVPDDVKDGRVLGGYLDVLFQMLRAPYETEAFNKDEVILVADRNTISHYAEHVVWAYVWLWYGMCKTLVGTQWSCWEEDSPEGKLRIKIAKKIDKWC